MSVVCVVLTGLYIAYDILFHHLGRKLSTRRQESLFYQKKILNCEYEYKSHNMSQFFISQIALSVTAGNGCNVRQA